MERERAELRVLTVRIDLPTVVGWGMLLMPLLTMWHEIGGHAAFCAAQGGHVATIGAFYVECEGLGRLGDLLVACAGVLVNALLAILAYGLWRRAKGDALRLVLWLVWVSEGFVAAGYFLFSGATGFGDLGVGEGGGLLGLHLPQAFRFVEVALGVGAYVLLVRAAITTLNAMIGTGPGTQGARRAIAHGYYAIAGAGAVLVGLMNPVGLVITIMSAAASSFGGLAGFISIGYANGPEDTPGAFVLARNWPVIAIGAAVLLGFALVLGPSVHP